MFKQYVFVLSFHVPDGVVDDDSLVTRQNILSKEYFLAYITMERHWIANFVNAGHVFLNNELVVIF